MSNNIKCTIDIITVKFIDDFKFALECWDDNCIACLMPEDPWDLDPEYWGDEFIANLEDPWLTEYDFY